MIEQQQFYLDISKLVGCPIEKVNCNTQMLDLVDNSFTLVELIIELQELYGIRFGQIELKSVENVNQLFSLFNSD